MLAGDELNGPGELGPRAAVGDERIEGCVAIEGDAAVVAEEVTLEETCLEVRAAGQSVADGDDAAERLAGRVDPER